jgi:hypothetical protein
VLQKNPPASIATLANTVQTVLVSMLNLFVHNVMQEHSWIKWAHPVSIVQVVKYALWVLFKAVWAKLFACPAPLVVL